MAREDARREGRGEERRGEKGKSVTRGGAQTGRECWGYGE